MKISKKELIELDACKDGLERFIRQTNNTDESVEVLSLIGGENTISDLLWLVGEKISKEKTTRFACDCALINIELIKPYTDKYDLIVEFLSNPYSKASATACAARAAAYIAAYADADAAYATRAADDAAHAAVYADAANAARNAANAARNAANAADCKDKINKLLVKLFS